MPRGLLHRLRRHARRETQEVGDPVPGTAHESICLDQEGRLWLAAAGNACVWVGDGGEVTDGIETDQGAYALGGSDGKTLSVAISTLPTGGAALALL